MIRSVLILVAIWAGSVAPIYARTLTEALSGLLTEQRLLQPQTTGIPKVDEQARTESTFSIGPGISGSWYDPAKDGQGYTLQILSSTQALVTWFTFDMDGNQLWMQGLGSIIESRLLFEDMFRIEGPRFGDDYDPDDRIIFPSGSLEISFSDCSSAVAEYSGSDILPPELLNLQRITRLGGIDCGSDRSPVLSGTIHPGLSGAWFDPAQDGQGWMIEILSDETALVYWFTYDKVGKQQWMLGIAAIEKNGLVAVNMLQPVGAKFGPGFASSDITFKDWGLFALSHVQCQRSVAYFRDFLNDDQGWYHSIFSLTSIAGQDPCAFPDGLASIEGGLEAASGSVVDGTTNDPNSRLMPNDSPHQSQPAGNPAVITGFATAEALGFGRFAEKSDEWDEYVIPLIAGQTLQLIIANWDEENPGRNDLDLYLFRQGALDPLDASLTTGRNEYIQILESGIYEVAVHAYAGSSAYTLHASYTPIPAQAQSFHLLGDYEDHELLIGFKDNIISKGLETAVLQSLTQDLGLEVVSQPAIGPTRVRINRTMVEAKARSQESGSIQNRMTVPDRLGNIEDEFISRRLLLLSIQKQIAQHADVSYVQPNFRATQFAGDPRRSEQWHYDAISLPAAWHVTRGDPDVLVAVIDTGVAPHPDLQGRIRYDLGFDAITLTNNLGPSSLPGDDPAFAGRTAPSSHGTHVAGTIAAVAENAKFGVGVAPDSAIMPIRVLENGGGTLADIVSGIYWAAGTSTASSLPDPERAADIINLSLGGFGPCSPAYQQAINYAVSRGLIVVAAAGNSSSSLAFQPASCENVISVAASNRLGDSAYYSNCGSNIWISAPGGEIAPSSAGFFQPGPSGHIMFAYLPFLSTACRYDPETSAGSLDGVWSTDFVYSGRTRSERFEPHAGTSMAAPHVAGVAALMRAVDQRLDAHAFMTLIASGAITNRSDGDSWDPQLGFGIIDARKAVDAVLLDGVSVASAVLSSPALLSFGEVAESRVVRLSPSGAGAGSIEGFVNNGHGWLRSARPLDVDANGFGYWEIGVDRQGLVEGLHLGAFTVRTSTDVEATIQADIRVGPPNLRGDAGFLYLGLFDALTGELVDLVGGSGFEGQYSYTMTGIVTGSYFLISFSDVSFSRKLCSPGNLCGFFPGTGPIEPLTVQAGRDNRVPTIVIQPDFSGLGEASAVQAAITADSEKQKSQSMVNWFSVPLNWPQLPVSRGAFDGAPVFGSDGPGMSNIFPVGTWDRPD